MNNSDTAAPPPPESERQPVSLEALEGIFSAANRSNQPGLVVGISHRGRSIYRRGFGLASLEYGIANTPETRMRIASVSKQFTCFGALLLAEEGKLDLDAPVDKLLPELPRLEGYPTLRQFMTHTSGLHDSWDMHFMARGLVAPGPGIELRSARRQTAVNFAPGQSQLYSNTGYGLLSIAIERASGMSFEKFMKTRVFEPLGMRDTESIPSDFMIVPRLATMHQLLPDGSWRRGIGSSEDNQGAGAGVSTVDDLLCWLAQLRGHQRKVGSDRTWQAMTEVVTLANGFRTAYACGLVRNQYRGVEVMHHGGSLIGVASQLITVPAHELDIAIIGNCELFNPVELANQVIDLVLGDALTEARPAFADSEGLSHLFGTRWHSPTGMLIGFEDVGGKLGFSFFHSPPIPMLERHGDELRLGGGGAGPYVLKLSELAPAADGTAREELTMFDAGTAIRFKRLPAQRPSSLEAGKDLIGSYRVADLDATARVEAEGEQLLLHIDTNVGTRSSVLEALSDHVFGVAVRDPVFPARYAMTVDRSRTGRPAFELDGGRTRHVRFEPIDAPRG
ncbi:serine hydrolase domain-containing protein [Roseateles violae]|uniref:Serine hydrolase domain-containing protein n=1 Tax=Roseateles violae TaxID=3058042 RepID=A0ABT8E004_9BURK|nr:serine hydrolase domain-containing protein [Pelomonas sp. PFR6]MDN3923197.1 serine hydrolase domain-containing protein [Pelomonas sp. PFR6]